MEAEAVREKVMAVPKLRFAEFSGAWSTGPLENVLDLKSGYIFKSETYVEDGRYRVITIANVQDGRMSFERVSTVSELPDNIRDFQVLQQGDILISLTGNVGRVCLVEVDDCLLNQRVGKLVPKAQVDKDFLYQVLRNEEFLNAMVEQAQGGAQDNLSSKDVLGYEAILPALPEQQKIAAFLDAVDRKIQQLKRKQALLEQYKKGVVQQLFSQELRFKRKDGGEFPVWEEKRLGDICSTFKSGEGITADEIDIGGEYPVYGGNGLRGFTDSFTHDGYYVLIGRQGALCGNINRVRGKVYISEHAIAVQCDKSSDTEWLAQLLTYMNLNRLSESSAQPGLAVNKLVQLKVSVPSLEEQSRIAGFLMALDAKVAGVAQAVAAAQKWKKGLLQGMFV
jgi:type I restriction enzyme S subunit